MDIYTIEIESARLQRERLREAELVRELGALEPLPRERQRGGGRRTAIALIGAALVTVAVVAGHGQAATTETAPGNVLFTPYFAVGSSTVVDQGAGQAVEVAGETFAIGEAAR